MKSFWQIFKDSFLEGEKGSGKAFAAYLTMMIAGFMCIWPTLHGEKIDTATLLELLGFVCVLYGIKGWVAVSKQSGDQKSAQ
jgi:hypothetical protein